MTSARPAREEHLTFRANMGVGRHGWLRLTPAYGVRLVRERLRDLPAGSVVTDPFSGTGTTPLAAAEFGHLGQSIDVNPFLIWLGTAKTRAYGSADLREASQQIADVVDRAHRTPVDAPLWVPPLHRIEKWWAPDALATLAAVRQGIDLADCGRPAKDLLELALCRTLIACSNAAFDHQSMSFRDGVAWERRAVLSSFTAEGEALVLSGAEPLPGSARIVPGDSRDLPDDLVLADLVLTSPPYVNRMSYIRELRPYMYWLRYLDRPSDAGELDWTAIGGTWGTATSRLSDWSPPGTTPVDDAMDAVCGRIAADGGRNGPVLAAYVRRYHHDMWRHFRTLERLLAPGGRVCYIIGNSTFYGHEVPAQEWYASMLRELGYIDVGVAVIRKRNSNKALFEYAVTAAGSRRAAR